MKTLEKNALSYLKKGVERALSRKPVETFILPRGRRTTSLQLDPSLVWWDRSSTKPVNNEQDQLPVISRHVIKLLDGREITMIRRDYFDETDQRRQKSFYLRHDGRAIDERSIDIDDWPLWGAEDLNTDGPVIVTEGIKSAESLRKKGHNALGLLASPPSDAALAPLSGRQVILWPDNDEHGVRVMAQVASRLVETGLEPLIVHWRSGRYQSDAADFTGSVEDLLATAELVDPVLLDFAERAERVEIPSAPLRLTSRRQMEAESTVENSNV